MDVTQMEDRNAACFECGMHMHGRMCRPRTVPEAPYLGPQGVLVTVILAIQDSMDAAPFVSSVKSYLWAS